jgi:hypothetical protein
MAKHPTLLQHFRSFAYQNHIEDFDTALSYFTLFGGTGWEIDVRQEKELLVEKKILTNYEALHQGITRYTHNNGLYHRLLSMIALGLNHEDALFKKTRVGKEKGEEAIDYLVMKSLLYFDYSVEKPLQKEDAKANRVFFRLPFMRFWFALVSPYYLKIQRGDFSEFKEKYKEYESNFAIELSNVLVHDLVKKQMTLLDKEDPIVSMGSYYDKHVSIEILAVRKSGKLIAGECKYSVKAAKIQMLETLKQKCEKVELEVSEYVLFSKHGFSAEFEALKKANIHFLTQKEMSLLLEDLSQEDKLDYKNKKY